MDFESVYACAGGETFSAGKRYFYDNKVKNLTSTDSNGHILIKALVEGKSVHDISVEFSDSGELLGYECDCVFFNQSKQPCKHVIALLLAYEDKFPFKPRLAKSVQRERTDPIALTLSAEYLRSRKKVSFASEADKAVLTPILKFEEGGRLKIRLGLRMAGKEYMVKDLGEFVRAVSEGAVMRYGTGFEFEHIASNFSSNSKELLNFLISSYNEKSDTIKMFNGTAKVSVRENMLLTLSDVDEFITLLLGQTVAFDDGEVRDSMRLVQSGENSLDISIYAEKVKGGFVLTGGGILETVGASIKQFNIVSGRKHDYIITDSRIIRVSHEFVTEVMPLIRAFWSFRRLYISDADMPYFYNNVLNQVLKHITLGGDEGVDLSVFEAAPLVAKLVVDIVRGQGLKAELKCAYEDEPVDILFPQASSSAVRDYEQEDALKDCLKKYFPRYPNLELSTDDEIYAFLSEGVSRILAFAEVYLEEGVRRMRQNKPLRIKVGVRIESNLLKVDFESDEVSREDLAKILSGYSERRNYVRLASGVFLELSDVSAATLTQVFDLPKDFDGTLTLPKFYAPHLNAVLGEGFFNLARDKSFKELIKELSCVRDADIEVPKSLSGVMRAYQKTGFRWLSTLTKFDFGGILADDMGLGKSLQVIALLCSSTAKKPSIIVCPTTLTLNWVNEIAKFAPHLKVQTVWGSSKERQTRVQDFFDADVIITSYELMRRDYELYKDFVFEYAIADEAQYIKNPDTKNAKAIKQLNANHRFALTGTPIENSLSELWSIFDFVMPGYLQSYHEFKEKFEIGIALGDKEKAQSLKSLVAPFVLRRLKTQVLTELPGKMEIEVEAPLEGEQKQIYQANLELVRDSIIRAKSQFNKITVLSMLTKLRQIACEPSLVYRDYEGNSAKLDTCLELVHEAVSGGHKVLLFSQFTSMLDIIRQKLVKSGITHFILKGDTPKNERLKLVKRFNEDDTNVFLISLKAGGTGLNLTGADVVIHYDPWWNESVMNQATDRAYRIGQDKPVQVYKLILKDTLEERILNLQKQKTSLSDMVLGEELLAGNANLSYDKIMEILK